MCCTQGVVRPELPPTQHPFPQLQRYVKTAYAPPPTARSPLQADQVSQLLGGEIVACWDFLQRFGPAIGVSSVSLDTFVDALLARERGPVPVLEAALALVRAIVALPQYRATLGIKANGDGEGEDAADLLADADAATDDTDMLLSAVGRAAVQGSVMSNGHHVSAATWQQVLRLLMYHDLPGSKQGAVASALAIGTGNGGAVPAARQRLLMQERLGPVLRECLVVLRKLMEEREADVFSVPIDTSAPGLERYYDVVDQPMDLSLIKQRMEDGCVHVWLSPCRRVVVLVLLISCLFGALVYSYYVPGQAPDAPDAAAASGAATPAAVKQEPSHDADGDVAMASGGDGEDAKPPPRAAPTGVPGAKRGSGHRGFLEDVRLVFSNCRAFNGAGSALAQVADRLSTRFEGWYRDTIAPLAAKVAVEAAIAAHQPDGVKDDDKVGCRLRL